MDLLLNSSSMLTSFIVLVFLTCALKLLNWVWFKPRKLEKLLRQQGLKGNPYKLFVGDAIELMSAIKAEQSRSIQFSDDLPSHILPYYKQMIEKHGENSFIWLGSSPTLLITDPRIMKDILSKPETFQKPGIDLIFETISGGLLFLDGDKWTLHRKTINPAFHMENLKNMTSSIGISCSNMMDRWEAELVCNGGESNEIDVWPHLADLSGDVISRTAFGSTHEQGRIIFELQKEQTNLVLQHMPYLFIPAFRRFPSKASRRIQENGKQIKSIVTSMISQRAKGIEKGEPTTNDLLGMLMESNYKEIQEHHGNKINAGMSVEDVIEECKLFYFAGSDSISVLLVWTMILLSKHQEWQARAREEVLRVFGKKEPTSDGLNHLKVVTMIIREVLRLYSPVSVTIRAPIKTTQLGKLTIPVGVRLILLIGMLHHDPEIWGEDVKEFNPERFSEGTSSATKVPFSFIPFGAGPRVCIGQHFALIEAKMALAMILQRFTFELSSSYVHDPIMILTTKPNYGAPLLFNKIQHN